MISWLYILFKVVLYSRAGGLVSSWILTFWAWTLSKFLCYIICNIKFGTCNILLWAHGISEATWSFSFFILLVYRFFWIRAGMMGWLLINLSVAAKQYTDQGSLSLSMALFQTFCAVWFYFSCPFWYNHAFFNHCYLILKFWSNNWSVRFTSLIIFGTRSTWHQREYFNIVWYKIVLNLFGSYGWIVEILWHVEFLCLCTKLIFCGDTKRDTKGFRYYNILQYNW